MASRNLTNYEDQGLAFKQRVWFDNQSTATVLRRGTGVCYNYAYVTTATGETATDSWAKRSKAVRLPDTTNNQAFAGVVAQDYGLIAAATAGRWIDIWLPGSICEVMVGHSTVIDTGTLTCSCSAPDVGIFSRTGLPGRGTMTPLQTVNVTDRNIAGGSAVGANLTITDSGLGTAIGSTSEAGDYVMYLFSHAITGTGVADATGVIGKFNLTYSSANAVTLTSTTAALGHDNATTAVAWTTGSTVYQYTVPKAGLYCLAYLHDGMESGLQEATALNYGSAVTQMVAGTTHYFGAGLTLAGATASAVFQVQPQKSNCGGLKRIFFEGAVSTTTGITIEDGSVTLFLAAGSVAATLTQVGTGDDALVQFTPNGDNAIVVMTDMTEA